MVEKLFALIVVLACAVMLLRMAVGARRVQRVDAALRRATSAVQRFASSVWHWREKRKAAARAAEEAIRRARKPRKLH
jgi:hypothetical protein